MLDCFERTCFPDWIFHSLRYIMGYDPDRPRVKPQIYDGSLECVFIEFGVLWKSHGCLILPPCSCNALKINSVEFPNNSSNCLQTWMLDLVLRFYDENFKRFKGQGKQCFRNSFPSMNEHLIPLYLLERCLEILVTLFLDLQ